MSFIAMPFAIISAGKGRMCRTKTVTKPEVVGFKLPRGVSAFCQAFVQQRLEYYIKDACIMAFFGLDDLSRRIFQSAAI